MAQNLFPTNLRTRCDVRNCKNFATHYVTVKGVRGKVFFCKQCLADLLTSGNKLLAPPKSPVNAIKKKLNATAATFRRGNDHQTATQMAAAQATTTTAEVSNAPTNANSDSVIADHFTQTDHSNSATALKVAATTNALAEGNAVSADSAPLGEFGNGRALSSPLAKQSILEVNA